MPTAIDYARQHGGRFEQQLLELLRIPSISTLKAHWPDARRAADWIAEDMRRIGMQDVQLIEHPDALPLVYGAWLGAGPNAPTLLIYTHYDVQPADRADGWLTDPFDPIVKDGKVFARGTLDSKMHLLIHLKSVEAALAANIPCPVNIKLLFEGEEETSSHHITEFLHSGSPLLDADLCVVSDGSLPDPNQPLLDYGLRGMVTAELIITGPPRDLHSGHYGGTVHNPIQALAEIIAALHDADGRVTIPGFYDAVRPMDDDERAALAGIAPVIAEEWRRALGIEPWGEPDYPLHERIGARPTLEFNGIAGGFAGEGFKTIIPHQARVKLSCRLVPDQQPDVIFDQLRTHLETVIPSTVTYALRQADMGSPAVLLERGSGAMQAAARAYERGWGRSPLYNRQGGSIPIVSHFLNALKLPVLLLPFGFKGGGAHSPNEYILLEMFHKGIETTLAFYEEIAVEKLN